MNKEKKFRFYAPAEIVKAKSPNGDTIMRLGGIASTTKEDSDGETLIPSGFDLTILKSEGFINWSHMKTPDAVIGEPYKAEIRKDGFYLEADLYNESAIAKSAYKLAQVLSKNSKNRKLGWSIEGTATERDPLNDKIVKKAKITGVALCLMPKNPGTFADIIKGEFDYLNDDELKKSEESTFELETINKALNSELIKAKILLADNLLKAEIGEEDDEEKKDGKTKKALSTGSSSGKAVARAHVDGDLKDQKMVKSLIMEKVFDMFPDIELNKAKNICKIILKVSDMNQKIKVPTEDEISKAMEVLGITKEEEYTEDSLVKAKSELDSLLEKETPQEELQKAFDLVSDIKEALKKGKAKDAEAEDEAEDEDEEDEGGEKDDLSKKMKMKKAKTEEKEDKEEAARKVFTSA